MLRQNLGMGEIHFRIDALHGTLRSISSRVGLFTFEELERLMNQVNMAWLSLKAGISDYVVASDDSDLKRKYIKIGDSISDLFRMWHEQKAENPIALAHSLKLDRNLTLQLLTEHSPRVYGSGLKLEATALAEQVNRLKNNFPLQ